HPLLGAPSSGSFGCGLLVAASGATGPARGADAQPYIFSASFSARRERK
ncbi:hypothetical protein A2U01_0072006, partial [Trifolium medium]|nr:hypothetical protein [Trifolium medium]